MRLTPHYGPDPILVLDGPASAVGAPAIRQRQRLAATLSSFNDEQWGHPSRCAGWTSRDVIVHLDSTNMFWFHAIGAGLRGEPTRFLTTFDPVASPAQSVAGDTTPANELLARFQASTDALVALWASLDDDSWSALAEAPPGHISVSAVTHHALWDSWVHERDVLLPLGIRPDEHGDEIAACLRYAAGLGPALARTRGPERRGVLAVMATDPETSIVVDIGDHVAVRSGAARPDADAEADADVVLVGTAIDLLESLSIRRRLNMVIPAEHTWMLSGLSETFDLTGD